MTNAVVRRLLLSSIALVMILSASLALAQSGSTGGSIGNDDKSLSGARETPRSVESEKTVPRANPSAKKARPPAQSRTSAPAPKTEPNPEGLIRMGGPGTRISDGNCVCKRNCSKATPLNPPLIAQCILSCEKTYSGCNNGMPR
jgi:hypothetical protein